MKLKIGKNTKNIKTLQKLLVVTASLTAVTLGSGCGANVSPGSGMVNNIQVKSYTLGSDQWLQMDTVLNTNGFQMSSINVPITDPRDHSVTYGNVSVASSLCNTKPCAYTVNLSVALNVTQASLSHTLDAYLPNGTAVPIGGIDASKIISLPIATTAFSNSRIYFAFDTVTGVGMVGAALTFSALDPVGHYVPGLNYFQPFQINNVSLSAGLFVGSETNTTGIGLFVDISNLMKPQGSLLARAMDSLGSKSSASTPSGHLTFKTLTPSKSKLKKLGLQLNNLSKRGAVLKLN